MNFTPLLKQLTFHRSVQSAFDPDFLCRYVIFFQFLLKHVFLDWIHDNRVRIIIIIESELNERE